MQDDIEMVRKSLQDIVGGFAYFAHSAIDANEGLTQDDRDLQHDAAKGVHSLIRGLIDFGAVAARAQRNAEDSDEEEG